MRLVEYASSASDSDVDADPPPNKRRRTSSPVAPPLPAAFHDLYAGPARLSRTDDRSLHGGRVRLVPHVEGNWAAHVYLEWLPTSAQHARLSSLVDSLTSDRSHALTTFLSSPSGVPQPLHISLSAPLILRTETKDDFRAAVVSRLSSAARALPEVSATGTLPVTPAGIGWHPNTEGTRGFLVLRVRPGAKNEGDALGKLLNASNEIAEQFGCCKLYAATGPGSGSGAGTKEAAGDKFHISIAWALDPALFPPGPIELPHAARKFAAQLEKMRIEFTDVKVKVGRDVTSVPLGRPRKAGANLNGGKQ